MEAQSKIDCEFTTMLEIKDNHPKYLVTIDEFWNVKASDLQLYRYKHSHREEPVEFYSFRWTYISSLRIL